MVGLSIDVSEVLKSPTVIVLLGTLAQVFLLLLPELPLTIFENRHFLPSTASSRSVTCSPVVAACASGVTGALLLPVLLLLLDSSLGAPGEWCLHCAWGHLGHEHCCHGDGRGIVGGNLGLRVRLPCLGLLALQVLPPGQGAQSCGFHCS